MLNLKNYVRIWLLFTLALAWEAWALNNAPFYSFWALLKENVPSLHDLAISPEPGKPVSLIYGYTGFGLMLLTNFYVARKRFKFLSSLGRLSGWLDLHIFFGLLGPVFILFHTNFKIGGLVAISFWSMVISFASGVVGRYFYVQMSYQKGELLSRAQEFATGMTASLKLAMITIDEAKLEGLKRQAVEMAGTVANADTVSISVSKAVWNSISGDLLFRHRMKSLTQGLPTGFNDQLRRYAVSLRRAAFLEAFRRVMGYWHSFHLPFAVFMYVVAIVHIAVALLFKVSAA